MSFEKSSCYVSQAYLELTILLLQHPECWDCIHVRLHLAASLSKFLIFKMILIVKKFGNQYFNDK
jgi:hypothetical protein